MLLARVSLRDAATHLTQAVCMHQPCMHQPCMHQPCASTHCPAALCTLAVPHELLAWPVKARLPTPPPRTHLPLASHPRPQRRVIVGPPSDLTYLHRHLPLASHPRPQRRVIVRPPSDLTYLHRHLPLASHPRPQRRVTVAAWNWGQPEARALAEIGPEIERARSPGQVDRGFGRAHGVGQTHGFGQRDGRRGGCEASAPIATARSAEISRGAPIVRRRCQ